jgi:2-iminobutanoate/2-iminopropanoate deaminase
MRSAVTVAGVHSAAGAYSHAVMTDELVFVSGQAPIDRHGEIVQGDFAIQAHAAFGNLAQVLEAAGSGLDDVVRVGVFLADLADFPTLNEVMRERFAEPFPARTTVPVDLPDFRIEVDAIAVRRRS